jgi:hypothetical protein
MISFWHWINHIFGCPAKDWRIKWGDYTESWYEELICEKCGRKVWKFKE